MNQIFNEIVALLMRNNYIKKKSEVFFLDGVLELLSESEFEQMFLSFVIKDNFRDILNKCADVTTLINITNIFAKIKLSQINEIKAMALDILNNSKYLERLNNYLKDITNFSDISEIEFKEFFNNCKIISEHIISPESKELLIQSTQFIETILMNNKKNELCNLKTDTNVHIEYDIQTCPQSCNSIPFYPEIKDILSKKVILSPNIIKGNYKNLNHYIDVQYNLLREDFISPLRKSIQCYKALKECNQIGDIRNIHIYIDACITKRIIDMNISYFVNFQTKDDCSVNSKRFMFGSLLVFSNNQFNSMFCGTVIGFGGNVLLSSKSLQFQPLDNNVIINMNSLYTMIECGTYFLPYMYAMKAFNMFNPCNFPMESYILYGKTEPQIPAYLNTNSTMYNINGLQFDILNDCLWSANTFFELDSTQSMAFKAALTKEVCIVQGPPGTGKTFIGHRILRTIIENLYETNILKSPILIISSTNDGLDQFLEGLINITDKIIRIGGRCKSNILKCKVLKDIECPTDLKKSYVIGLTIVGALKRHSALLNVHCPIVFVEGAADILEPFLIASLTQHCQHLILIGDHMQLRPKTASYVLAKKCNFDVSLFERMINHGFPYYSLTTQHRMRPTLSTLLQPIYPLLMDHESVKNRSNIRGLAKNVYFIHHEKNEEKSNLGNESYSNIHEANFLIELTRYLYLQGYQQNQITILVTYKQQLLELQKIRDSSLNLEDFQIECVDNYRGKENDIILLSLVRNNINNNIGYLNIQNRICVALSRARYGLYIMGNMNNLKHSSIWKQINNALLKQISIGDKLTLRCEIHNDWIKTVCDSSDFLKARCIKVCNMKMDCSHHCPQLCHYYDQSHETLYRCKQPYTKILSCGFKIEVECWMKFLTYECPQ